MTFHLDSREYQMAETQKSQDLRKALKDKSLTTDNIIQKIAVTVDDLSIHKNRPVEKVRF